MQNLRPFLSDCFNFSLCPQNLGYEFFLKVSYVGKKSVKHIIRL